MRLRYQELKQSSRASFSHVLDRLGLETDASTLDEAIASASPERIGSQFGAGFVHTASDGSYRQLLTQEQRERAKSAFQSEIERYGLGD